MCSTLEEKHDVEVRKGSVELPKLITNSDLLKKDVESSQYPVTKSQTVATLTFRFVFIFFSSFLSSFFFLMA